MPRGPSILTFTLALASLSACIEAPDLEDRPCSEDDECTHGLVCSPERMCIRAEQLEGAGAGAGGAPMGPQALEVPDDLRLVADSVEQFSGEQGHLGWRYGGMLEGDTFEELPLFENGAWRYGPKRWTHLTRDRSHPNGAETSNQREGVNQAAVRRWISTVAGPVVITGRLAKANVSPASNGVRGRILVDGVEVWEQTIEGTDGNGVVYTVSTTVALGSAIDWATDALGNDWSDASFFSGAVLH